jgi:hypothetical protein
VLFAATNMLPKSPNMAAKGRQGKNQATGQVRNKERGEGALLEATENVVGCWLRTTSTKISVLHFKKLKKAELLC